MKFPLTLEAIKKGDQNQWAIGDALLAECGPPSTVGMKDGRSPLLQEAAEYLLGKGFESTASTLSWFRCTSYSFKSADRRSGVAWGAHRKAGTPEYLEAIIAGAPKGTNITQDYIEDIRQTQRKELQRKREEENRKAVEAREKAETVEAEARQKSDRVAIEKSGPESRGSESQRAGSQISAAPESRSAQGRGSRSTGG